MPSTEPTRMSEQSARTTLGERDRTLLAFESRWAAHTGAKEEAIRGELDLAPARYYQLLNRLIDTEAALAHEPMLVGRLRRIRDETRRSRSSRGSRIAG